MRAIWDTGSDWFFIEIDYCDNCDETFFDSRLSTTFETVVGEPNEISTFGDGKELEGDRIRDQVCLADFQDACGLNFEFLGIIH